MKRYSDICKFVLAAAMISMTAVSCERDRLERIEKTGIGGGETICFSASMGDDESKTRSGASVTSRKAIGKVEIAGESAFLLCEESMLEGTVEGPSTKGTPVNSANFDDVYGSFAVDALAFFEEGGEIYSEIIPALDREGKIVEWEYGEGYTDWVFFKNVPFTRNDGVWSIPTDEFPQYASFYWPKLNYSADSTPDNYMPLSFFAYAPTYVVEPKQGMPWAGWEHYPGPDGEGYPTLHRDGKMEFYHLLDYWDIRNITFNPDYTISRNSERFEVCVDDAETQPDLLLASSGIVNCPQEGNPIPLKFYHILSGIRFKVADDFPVGAALNYIRFDNVWWDGYCVFDPNASGSTSADKVSWTFPEDCAKASFRQNFNVEVAAARDFDNDKIQSGDMLYKDDVTKTFMMIPQSFGSSGNSPDATICIGITVNGEDKEIEMLLPDGTQWLAGKLYTYSLSLTFNDNDDDVEVKIEEDFEDPGYPTEIYNKENIRVKNIATASYYFRVAILAYEIDGDEKVATWWKDEVQWLYTAADAASLSEEYNDGIPGYDWDLWTLKSDNDWVKHGDYYYYRYPVEGSSQTKILCDKLRVPCLTTKQSEVDVICQGLPWNEGDDPKGTVRTYWGEDVAALLYDYPETDLE